MIKEIKDGNIIIRKAVVQSLDRDVPSPMLSERIMALDEDVDAYLQAHILKAFNSEDAKNTALRDKDGFFGSRLSDIEDNFIECSKEIALRYFSAIQNSLDMPSGDLVIMIAQIENEDYLVLIKMNYKCSYVHEYKTTADIGSMMIVKRSGILPAKGSKTDEAAFINIDTMEVRVLEKKYEINGQKDYCLSAYIVDCATAQSSKSKMDIIKKTAEKVYEDHYGDTIDTTPKVCSVLYDEVINQDTVKIDDIISKFTQEYPEAGGDLEEALENKNIKAEEEIEVPVSVIKKLARQSVKSSAGVEVKIPTKAYDDRDAVEFVNNADGSVSLIIKNIIKE